MGTQILQLLACVLCAGNLGLPLKFMMFHFSFLQYVIYKYCSVIAVSPTSVLTSLAVASYFVLKPTGFLPNVYKSQHLKKRK